MRKINTLFILCIVTSCVSTSNYISVRDFPIVDTLKMRAVNTPPTLLSPSNMFVTGDYLVVAQHKGDALFSFFNLPDCSFAFNDGLRGKGPNEFNSINPNYFEPTDKGFKVLDNGVVIKDLIIDKEQLIVKSQYKVPTTGRTANNIMKLENDRLCIVNTLDDLSEYLILDTVSNEVPVSPYPKWCSDDMSQPKMFVYIKNSIASPKGDKFMSFYANFRKMRLHNSNGDLLKEVSVETPFELPQYSDDRNDRYITYASYPFADEKHIYVFCINSKLGDQSQTCTELQVWDWDGKPVARLILDKNLSLFTISPKFKQLYACTGCIEDTIFVCDIPKYLYNN